MAVLTCSRDSPSSHLTGHGLFLHLRIEGLKPTRTTLQEMGHLRLSVSLYSKARKEKKYFKHKMHVEDLTYCIPAI